MGHSHDHSHGDIKNYNKAFIIGIGLNVAYIIIEVTYGLIIDSLALIADAGHNLSDVLGLILAWAASYLVTKKPTHKYTYGFRKSSILAAFLNALILMVAIGGIMWEAIKRMSSPEPVEGMTIVIVAAIGVFINAATAFLFFSGRKGDLNIKGAFMHMAADAGISLGVVVTGLLIFYFDWYWIDPVVSITIAVIIFIGTWGLFKDSLNLALDAVPKDINKGKVEGYLKSLPGVSDVHDLHIWAMSTTETALTVHLVRPEANLDDDFTKDVCHDLHHKFGIGHSTIQIEQVPKNTNCDSNEV